MTLHTDLRTRALALAAVLAVAAAGSAAGETVTKTLQKDYPLAAGGEVRVENTNGAIVVETWDRPEVRVRATKKVRAGSPEAAAEIMERLRVRVETGTDRLHVSTGRNDFDQGFFAWLRGQAANASVSYHLIVPRGIRLVAETVNGAVTLDGVDGDFVASTTNGAIKVDDARGRVDASTTNGSISVDMAEVAPDADLDFSTTNGAVTVSLPEDVRTDLRLRTTNGGIKVDLPVEVTTQSRRRLDGSINGGGGSLRVETTNGSIRIRRS
ncbi:MAG TPA: DUF4097 family beta strand repeat-containing protein [Thermoanaerobaculia bacterium]